MSSFLDKCEEYFLYRDFYDILKINKDATSKEVKKAYHKLSLLVHPDRVGESEKLIANEKFKVLGRIHSILQDTEKRKIYDETGDFDDEDSDSTANWMDYWRSMFKKITIKDIEDYEREYIGSETELRDIKKAYIGGKGDMEVMYELVPFCNLDSESRIIEIVRKMVDDGEVEEYPCFFNEPKRKKEKRRKKLEKEKAESLEIDLEKEIQKNRKKRDEDFFDLLSSLEAKYGDKGKKGGTKRKSIKSDEGESSGHQKKKRVPRPSKK